MSKVLIFSVYDKAVGAYMTPFFAPSKGAAIRSFNDAVNDQQHQFFKHKTDYTLMFLGAFDDASGELLYSATGPEKLLQATEVSIPSSDNLQ